MRKFLLITLVIGLLVLSVQVIYSQDSEKLLNTYKRNFAIASLDVKLQILQDAANTGSTDMGPLYLQALDFVLDNASFIESDTRFRQLALVAIQQIDEVGFENASYSLWQLFQGDEETVTRVAIMEAMSSAAKSDEEIIDRINQWLEAQNNVFRTGKIPDLQVLATCIQTLGKIGRPSSFPIIFSAMNLGYSDSVAGLAEQALLQIQGDFQELLLGILKNSPLQEKKQALIMALESDRLDDTEKGEVAEAALDIGLHIVTRDVMDQEAARDMRFMSVTALSERKWSKATNLIVEHLNTILAEYERGIAAKSYLLEAIAALGNMGTHEAAERLTGYLILLNSFTEKGRGYDEQLVLAVISNIGKLGDKVSFDDLIYTQYLNYSKTVKKEAEKAVKNINW